MPTYCVAQNCKNVIDKKSGLSSHMFPKDPELRQRWIFAVNRKDFVPTKSSKLCSAHFEEGAFEVGGIIRKLKKDAVPKLFDFSQHLQKHQRKPRRIIHKFNLTDDGSRGSAKGLLMEMSVTSTNDECPDEDPFALDSIIKEEIRRENLQKNGKEVCYEGLQQRDYLQMNIKKEIVDEDCFGNSNVSVKEEEENPKETCNYDQMESEEVVIKKEIESDEEEINKDSVIKEELMDFPEFDDNLKYDPLELKTDVKRELKDEEPEVSGEDMLGKDCGVKSDLVGDSSEDIAQSCKEGVVDKKMKKKRKCGKRMNGSAKTMSSSPIKKFLCNYCGKSFSLSIHLETHLRIHTGEKPFCCHFCPKSFARSDSLKKHLRTHTGEKPFSCQCCNKSFSTADSLKMHLRTHFGERPFSCEYCSKTFCTSDGLKKHLRTHTGEKPFSCKFCNKTCSQSSALNRHLRIHTGEKPFSCQFCEKSFSVSSHLRDHLRTHTGEKPFSCQYCEKTFAESSKLKIHVRTHTGEKPFTCKYCNRSFSVSGSLKIHVRTHTGEKPFPCQLCDLSFAIACNLKKHMLTHTGEKPFSCPVCEKKFPENGRLKKHLRVHTSKTHFLADIPASNLLNVTV